MTPPLPPTRTPPSAPPARLPSTTNHRSPRLPPPKAATKSGRSTSRKQPTIPKPTAAPEQKTTASVASRATITRGAKVSAQETSANTTRVKRSNTKNSGSSTRSRIERTSSRTCAAAASPPYAAPQQTVSLSFPYPPPPHHQRRQQQAKEKKQWKPGAVAKKTSLRTPGVSANVNSSPTGPAVEQKSQHQDATVQPTKSVSRTGAIGGHQIHLSHTQEPRKIQAKGLTPQRHPEANENPDHARYSKTHQKTPPPVKMPVTHPTTFVDLSGAFKHRRKPLGTSQSPSLAPARSSSSGNAAPLDRYQGHGEEGQRSQQQKVPEHQIQKKEQKNGKAPNTSVLPPHLQAPSDESQSQQRRPDSQPYPKQKMWHTRHEEQTKQTEKTRMLPNLQQTCDTSSDDSENREIMTPKVRRYPGAAAPVYPLIIDFSDCGDTVMNCGAVFGASKGTVMEQRYTFEEKSWALKKKISRGCKNDEVANVNNATEGQQKEIRHVSEGDHERGVIASVKKSTESLSREIEDMSITSGISRLRGGGEGSRQRRGQQSADQTDTHEPKDSVLGTKRDEVARPGKKLVATTQERTPAGDIETDEGGGFGLSRRLLSSNSATRITGPHKCVDYEGRGAETSRQQRSAGGNMNRAGTTMGGSVSIQRVVRNLNPLPSPHSLVADRHTTIAKSVSGDKTQCSNSTYISTSPAVGKAGLNEKLTHRGGGAPGPQAFPQLVTAAGPKYSTGGEHIASYGGTRGSDRGGNSNPIQVTGRRGDVGGGACGPSKQVGVVAGSAEIHRGGTGLQHGDTTNEPLEVRAQNLTGLASNHGLQQRNDSRSRFSEDRNNPARIPPTFPARGELYQRRLPGQASLGPHDGLLSPQARARFPGNVNAGPVQMQNPAQGVWILHPPCSDSSTRVNQNKVNEGSSVSRGTDITRVGGGRVFSEVSAAQVGMTTFGGNMEAQSNIGCQRTNVFRTAAAEPKGTKRLQSTGRVSALTETAGCGDGRKPLVQSGQLLSPNPAQAAHQEKDIERASRCTGGAQLNRHVGTSKRKVEQVKGCNERLGSVSESRQRFMGYSATEDTESEEDDAFDTPFGGWQGKGSFPSGEDREIETHQFLDTSHVNKVNSPQRWRTRGPRGRFISRKDIGSSDIGTAAGSVQKANRNHDQWLADTHMGGLPSQQLVEKNKNIGSAEERNNAVEPIHGSGVEISMTTLPITNPERSEGKLSQPAGFGAPRPNVLVEANVHYAQQSSAGCTVKGAPGRSIAGQGSGQAVRVGGSFQCEVPTPKHSLHAEKDNQLKAQQSTQKQALSPRELPAGIEIGRRSPQCVTPQNGDSIETLFQKRQMRSPPSGAPLPQRRRVLQQPQALGAYESAAYVSSSSSEANVKSPGALVAFKFGTNSRRGSSVRNLSEWPKEPVLLSRVQTSTASPPGSQGPFTNHATDSTPSIHTSQYTVQQRSSPRQLQCPLPSEETTRMHELTVSGDSGLPHPSWSVKTFSRNGPPARVPVTAAAATSPVVSKFSGLSREMPSYPSPKLQLGAKEAPKHRQDLVQSPCVDKGEQSEIRVKSVTKELKWQSMGNIKKTHLGNELSPVSFAPGKGLCTEPPFVPVERDTAVSENQRKDLMWAPVSSPRSDTDIKCTTPNCPCVFSNRRFSSSASTQQTIVPRNNESAPKSLEKSDKKSEESSSEIRRAHGEFETEIKFSAESSSDCVQGNLFSRGEEQQLAWNVPKILGKHDDSQKDTRSPLTGTQRPSTLEARGNEHVRSSQPSLRSTPPYSKANNQKPVHQPQEQPVASKDTPQQCHDGQECKNEEGAGPVGVKRDVSRGTQKPVTRRYPKLLDLGEEGAPKPVGLKHMESKEQAQALLLRIQISNLRQKKESLEEDDALAIQRHAKLMDQSPRDLLARRRLRKQIMELQPDATRSIVRIVTQRPDFKLTSAPIEVKLDVDTIDDDLIRQLEVLVRRETDVGTPPIAPDIKRLRRKIRKGKLLLSALEKGLTIGQLARLEMIKPMRK